MNLISALYRHISIQGANMFSFFRVLHYNISYQNLSIDFKTKIESGCKIECDNGSRMILKNCYISSGSYISSKHSGQVTITDTFIGRNTTIVGVNRVKIASNCLIAEMVVIRDQDHNYNEDNIPVKECGYSSAPIDIEENVWIANKSTILKGVTIGQNAVIGAHSLVNKSIESGSVAVGTPAKVIKNKFCE